MDPLAFWEDSTIPSHHKYDNSIGSGGSRAGTPHVKEEQTLYRYCDSVTGNLNFSTVATSEDDDYSYHKKKMSRDPMSHRIIEKRRRDRMNNCLADLSRLIPADYMKKGRGRIEKTEIIEMAIKHMKHLQDHHATCHLGNCEMDHHQGVESEESYSPPESHSTTALVKVCGTSAPLLDSMSVVQPASLQIVEEHYRLGYHECLSETMHFLVEVEGMFAGDKLCVQLISHLQRHCDKILKGGGLNAPRVHTNETTSSSSLGSKERSSGSGSSSDGGERPGGINGSGDEPYYNSASQLRDILTSNHVAGRLKMVQEPPSPPNSINGASSLTENHSSSGSLYKFKNNIKQRFSAEHSEGIEEQSHPLALKRRRSNEHRQGCETSSLPSPPPDKYQQPASPSPPPPPLPGVPIFALHSKGSFYIPLTVDHHLLAPFLPDLRDIEANLSSVVLHPVTISVNFQQTAVARSRSLKQPLCFTPSSPPPHDWSPATTPHNYLPLPKWATCAPHLN